MAPDFSIVAGDTPTIRGTVSGFTSIAGYTITMSAKTEVADTTPIFTLTAVIDNPTASPATFHFLPTATQTNQAENIYYYDLKVVDNNGVPQHTKRSIFQITEPIT